MKDHQLGAVLLISESFSRKDRTVRGLLDLFTAPKSQWSKHRLSESFLSAVKKRRSNWNAAWLEKWEVKV